MAPCEMPMTMKALGPVGSPEPANRIAVTIAAMAATTIAVLMAGGSYRRAPMARQDGAAAEDRYGVRCLEIADERLDRVPATIRALRLTDVDLVRSKMVVRCEV